MPSKGEGQQDHPGMNPRAREQRRINPAIVCTRTSSPIHRTLFRRPATSSPVGSPAGKTIPGMGNRAGENRDWSSLVTSGLCVRPHKTARCDSSAPVKTRTNLAALASIRSHQSAGGASLSPNDARLAAPCGCWGGPAPETSQMRSARSKAARAPARSPWSCITIPRLLTSGATLGWSGP